MQIEKISDTYHRITFSDGSQLFLVGTAHVSSSSVDQVRAAIEEEDPDTICIELDSGRLQSKQSSWQNQDIRKVFKEKKGFLLLANTALASFQKRLGAQTGISPGDELLAEFTEETGISVIFNEVSWDDIRDKVSIAASGGEAAADVIEVDWSWVGEMNSAGWLEPIEMTDEDKEDMPTLETFTIDGEILAVPYANDYRIAYYNKEHFEQAGITEVPETWDEVYDALKKIKEAGIVEYPYTMPMNADESATTSMMWMAFSRSGQVFNDDDTLNEEAVMDALTFENQLVQDGFVDPASISFNGMDCYRKITSGEASFMVGPTKFVGISNDPEQCSEIGNIVPILLPGTDGTSPQTMALPEAVGITSFSENKEAAQEFVKWYSSADVQKRMYAVNSSNLCHAPTWHTCQNRHGPCWTRQT